MCLVWDVLCSSAELLFSIFSPQCADCFTFGIKEEGHFAGWWCHQAQWCKEDICLPGCHTSLQCYGDACCCRNCVGNCKVLWGCYDQTVMWQYCIHPLIVSTCRATHEKGDVLLSHWLRAEGFLFLLPSHLPSRLLTSAAQFVICGMGSTSWACTVEGLISSAHIFIVFWDEMCTEICISTHITCALQVRGADCLHCRESFLASHWRDKKNIRKNIFTERVLKPWSRLPREVIDAPCLSVFKRHLAMLLIICFNFWAALKWSGSWNRWSL